MGNQFIKAFGLLTLSYAFVACETLTMDPGSIPGDDSGADSGEPPVGEAPMVPPVDSFSFECHGSQTFQAPSQVGAFSINYLDEASGLAISRSHPGVLWTHNDNSGDARIYAANVSGARLATVTVGLNADAVDVEDVAIGPGPQTGIDYLYIAHIGDNNNVRTETFVYRFPEPVVNSTQSPVEFNATQVQKIRLAYPSNHMPSHKDAETLMVDLNGDIYIFTKRTSPTSLAYVARYPQSTTAVNTLEYLGPIPFYYPTGGDLSPNGRLIGLRTYTYETVPASIFVRGVGESLYSAFSNGSQCNIPLQYEYQGEAFAWDSMSLGFFTTTEIKNSGLIEAPLLYYSRN